MAVPTRTTTPALEGVRRMSAYARRNSLGKERSAAERSREERRLACLRNCPALAALGYADESSGGTSELRTLQGDGAWGFPPAVSELRI